MTDRRRMMQAALAGLALPWPGAAPPRPAGGERVLREAFDTAETGFDPARVDDVYSRRIIRVVFEAPLAWDYLARPYRLVPLTARALPEVSGDHRTFTLRLRPGIWFADDPAFAGERRELVAEDYVFSWKRHFDPGIPAGYSYTSLAALKIVGLDALRRRAIESRRAFDYDTPVEGLRALDRYTLQVRLAEPAPRFPNLLADSASYGALAREVVERYGAAVGEHPVGTGPFRLAEWRRSSRIVLERNPDYRWRRYDAQPAAGDAVGQAIAARFAGRRLPMLDRIEISVIGESQPRWLAFLQRAIDVLELPNEFAPLAAPSGALAPFLARQGVQMQRTPVPIVSFLMFNMEHPLVGGYAPGKVALRRAISLAYDVEEEIRLLRGGQAMPAQGPIAPETFGYDPAWRSVVSEYDPARARALLDLYGWVDRDRDGWREQPDGRPLVLEMMAEPDQRSRSFDELLRRRLAAVGLRVAFRIGQWPENSKSARAGRYMIWYQGWSLPQPDSDSLLALAYGPNRDTAGGARFVLPAYDALYRSQRELPDGPERAADLERAVELLAAYMPYKYTVWRTTTELLQPWVVGYRHHDFASSWPYVDVGPSARLAPAA